MKPHHTSLQFLAQERRDRTALTAALCLLLSFATATFAQDGSGDSSAEPPPSLADQYQEIVRDYRTIAPAMTATRRAALDRITRQAYRSLIQASEGQGDLSADDLYALGACHEAIGESETAINLYEQSLAAEPQAKSHLALVRVYDEIDMAKASAHFEEAAKLQPGYPGLAEYQRGLALGYERIGEYANAATWHKRYAENLELSVERDPTNRALASRLAAQEKRAAQLERLAAMIGGPPPSLNVERAVQGEAVDLAKLKGKVVLLDVFAIWAGPSQSRMQWLAELQTKHAADGLVVVGLARPYQYYWDVISQKGAFDAAVTPDKEAEAIVAFAKDKKLTHPLSLVPRETMDSLAVETLPHTLVIDRQGNIAHIILAANEERQEFWEEKIAALLK